MAVPGTSFHLKNEKISASLSLLEHEESSDGGSGGHELPKEIIVPGHEVPVKPPPRARVHVFPSVGKFILSLIVTGLFLLCLPLIVVIYLCIGLVPRVFVRLLLSCSNGGRYSLMPISRGFGSTNDNHHTVMLIVRGRCDIEKIRKHMTKVLNSLDPCTGNKKFIHLQQRVAKKFGYLCHEERYPKFDIKNHVKHFDIRRKNIFLSFEDIIPLLETSYDEPFENVHTAPQWELLVIPKFAYVKDEAKLLGTSDRKQFYALIFRFHHGIMNWNMLQELLVEFLGKTSGRIRSIFSPATKKSRWTLLKTYLAVLFAGPLGFMNQLCHKWKRFGDLNITTPRISLSTTKPFDTEAFDDVKSRTFTTIDSVLANCVRIAARNLVLGQNLEVPRDMRVARVFNTMTCELQGVDSFSINFNKYSIALERLQGTFHAIERQQGACSLAAQRLFNKTVMLLAGVFPYNLSAWLYKVLLKGDVILEVWPGADEPCTIFGDDLIADIVGWAGISGVDADMKVTVTTYCGRVRANFTGRQGFFGSLTDSQILSYEFEEEFKKLAAIAGIYQSRVFLPPAVDNGI
ncbi:hypothetical protein Ocin01_12092 [Orchesella cincta]|uniref:Uncharacterized protein n=1 Tax=Orchesella cincta TaxID=48709 RepID=A0A1D2MP04_ORCCI|nr:hypothetical protein Ocin01_12092 [Orchesella cincta]